MSLSIEVRVNGHPVVTLEAHNEGQSGATRGLCSYRARAVHFTLDGAISTCTFNATHQSDNGMVELAAILMSQFADATKTQNSLRQNGLATKKERKEPK